MLSKFKAQNLILFNPFYEYFTHKEEPNVRKIRKINCIFL